MSCATVFISVLDDLERFASFSTCSGFDIFQRLLCSYLIFLRSWVLRDVDDVFDVYNRAVPVGSFLLHVTGSCGFVGRTCTKYHTKAW